MELQCLPVVHIDDIQIYKQSFKVKGQTVASIKVHLAGDLSKASKINFQVVQPGTSKPIYTSDLNLRKLDSSADDFSVGSSLFFGKQPLFWDKFQPDLYAVITTLTTTDGHKQILRTQFGLRDFTVKGTQLQINGRTAFLRGTVENCVFPLTGYASMKEADWECIFRICKSYGLNHMRFHSYCLPEAAFDAADRVGFYLQPEGPSWANHGSSLGDGKPIDQFIYDETNRMVAAYGNHPSYCMLAYGNEPRGGIRWST